MGVFPNDYLCGNYNIGIVDFNYCIFGSGIKTVEKMKTRGYYKFALKVCETTCFIEHRISKIKTKKEAEINLMALKDSYNNLKYYIHFSV